MPLGAWWAALVASVAVLWVARRRSIASRANPPSRAVGVEPDDGRLLAVPYDHESEYDDSARTVDVTR